MNNLDKQYQALLQDILDNGHDKGDRTGTGTKSVFPRMITHNMAEGFPLLTTKKMYHKGIFTELLWLLRGDTNIQWLCQNDCNIWVGDAYKSYLSKTMFSSDNGALEELDGMDLGTGELKKVYKQHTKEGFIERIKTDDEFAEEWGDLGPIYGKQWRNWEPPAWNIKNGGIDQIANALNDLTNNPDSRRIMVNAWNVGEVSHMTLPPCHFGFQLWTRELSSFEREEHFAYKMNNMTHQERCELHPNHREEDVHEKMDEEGVPRRAISLTWQQRSVDTFLGLPFNIASYGALLMIFGELVNMVPETLTGVLGDTHLYNNHLEQAKEQIGNEPFDLPNLRISTEFWNPENVLGTNWDEIIKGIELEDFQLEDYVSHETIKAPLSN